MRAAEHRSASGRPRPRRLSREPVRTILHDLTGRGTTGLPAALVVHPGVVPATGSVYQRLADELAVDHDVFVLDLTGIAKFEVTAMAGMAGGDGDVTIADVTNETVAQRFCEASGCVVRAPAAVLVGWSFGGTLAFEMARQATDRKCGLPEPLAVLLLDSMAPQATLAEDPNPANPVLLRWFAMYLGAKRGGELRLDEERFAGMTVDQGLAVIRDEAVERDLLDAQTPAVGLRKLYDTYADGLLYYRKLASTYWSPPTHRPLTLVKAEEGSLRPGDRDMGWSALTEGGLTVRRCPGDHYTMLSEPRATAVLAQLIRERSDALLAAKEEVA